MQAIKEAVAHQQDVRNQQEALGALERTWRECVPTLSAAAASDVCPCGHSFSLKQRRYAYDCSKEAGKVLKQLIDVLLHPIDDVYRYITVLEHLCWLADEMGESEITCPVVQYAAQLVLQLKNQLRSSSVSKRTSLFAEHDSDSMSSDSDSSDFAPPRSKLQASPRVPAAGSAAPNFSSVLKAMKPNSASTAAHTPLSARVAGSNQRNPAAASTAAPKAHRTKSAVLAVLASQNFKHAGDAAAAARMSGRALDRMQVELAHGGSGARAAAGRADKSKPAGLMAVLAASAFRSAGSAATASRLAEEALRAMKEELAAASEVEGIELQQLPPDAAADADDLELKNVLLEVSACVPRVWCCARVGLESPAHVACDT